MSEKLVLIDGHSIIHRAFYGVPDLTNSEGFHTNGIYGFLNIMFKIIEEEKPDYLAVAFDRKEPTFRHKRYQEYKGTRKPMPAELREQVPVLKELLEAMKIPVITQAGIEADDILGTLAVRGEREEKQVTVVSGDRDLLQLATDRILVRIPKTKRGGTEIEDYHAEEVKEKYGITPKQVIDMKGLMGDSSDNIPGVPGVGEKTAQKLLDQFHSVEETYERLEEVEPKRIRGLLEEHRELAFLSKELATIKTDCEIDFEWERAKCKDIFTEEAYEQIHRLELKSLEKRFSPELLLKASASDIEFHAAYTKKETEQFMVQIKKDKPDVIGISFWGDTWMNEGAVKKKAKKPKEEQISLVFDENELSLSVDKEEIQRDYAFYGMGVIYRRGEEIQNICCIACEDLPKEYLISLYRELENIVQEIALIDWKDIMHHLTPVTELTMETTAPNQEAFADETVPKLHLLYKKIFDVSLGAYLLNPLKNSYELEDIARDYLGKTVMSREETFGKQSCQDFVQEEAYRKMLQEQDRESELSEKVTNYIGQSAYVAYAALPVIKKELEEQDMLSLMREIEMPTTYFLYQMERVGVHADKNELAGMSKLLEQRVLNAETDIFDLAGEEFNINSPKQLGVILFEKLKLPNGKKTKTGYSTSAEVLEKLKNEDPIVSKILDYRQVAKLKSTYADGLPIFIGTDKRIHGKFNQMITATGRISSTDPNLQNIPIRMELGRELRKVFKPKEGCVFLDADYSQIELRLLAHMSGDEELIRAYRENQDIHRSTASKVFHTPFDEVTDLQRRNAKAVNFGIVYGISSYGLSQDLNISKKEAQEYIDEYFATYPKVKEFMDYLVSEAKEKGYAKTLFGRKRPIPELNSGNFMQRSFGERVAKNSPIQGTAADIMKLAMIRVAERLRKEKKKAEIVLQVHDELLLEVPFGEKEEVKKLLLEEMEGVVSLSIPLEVEVLEGMDWKEAH